MFFFSSRRRHTRYWRDWSSDVCSSDLRLEAGLADLRGEDRARARRADARRPALALAPARDVELGRLAGLDAADAQVAALADAERVVERDLELRPLRLLALERLPGGEHGGGAGEHYDERGCEAP